MAHFLDFDVLIIGSGAAGLGLALRLPSNLRIGVVSKRELCEGNTLYAQGGISAVLDASDSVDSHIHDTLEAGADLCDESTVRLVVEHGPRNIRWLKELGVEFTRSSAGDFHLTREGGHSHRRVVHAADATGRAVQTVLAERVQMAENISLLEHHLAVDLIIHADDKGRRCVGAYLLNLGSREVTSVRAPSVVLASGGASKVYLYSSNPDVATGDGIAMAWRAGCRVANMEFMQFHPTCLYHPQAKSFLISEAVRGEGGLLVNAQGQRFMDRYHPRAELAPRDVVARAIDHEMKKTGADCVYLDISHRPLDFVSSHFPNIVQRCRELGIDPTREPMPVVPAAHYTCGGVMTDHRARTDLPGLYAIGETAYTGLHGANRMASNSLLECLVFSELGAEDIGNRHHEQSSPEISIPAWDASRVTESEEDVVVAHDWDELRRVMWDYVGIVRNDKRLALAQSRIALLRQEVNEHYGSFLIDNDLIELRNLIDVADLIIRSAQQRKESRGLNYNLDYPHTEPAQRRPTILTPANFTQTRIRS